LEHGIAILYYDLFLNHGDFICVYILAQNKENCWIDLVTHPNFAKKNPNLFLNWDFLNYLLAYAFNQASFSLFAEESVALRPSFSS
jgi:hypothetical protein